MAQINIKGRVARVGNIDGTNDRTVHIVPDRPETLRDVDGTYKAGADAIAVRMADDATPEVGERITLTAEEVHPGQRGAYLRAASGDRTTRRNRREGGNDSAPADDAGGNDGGGGNG